MFQRFAKVPTAPPRKRAPFPPPLQPEVTELCGRVPQKCTHRRASMRFGKGCFLSLTPDSNEPKKPHPAAKCIVKWPCLCCWLSFAIVLILSIVGWYVVIQAAPPDAFLGPLRFELNYPPRTPVAIDAEALKEAKEASDEAMRTWTSAQGRRLGESASGSAARGTHARSPSDTPLAARLLAGLSNTRQLSEIVPDEAAVYQQAPSPPTPACLSCADFVSCAIAGGVFSERVVRVCGQSRRR